MEQIDLSIVVPVYNEEENLRPLLAEITAALKDEPITYEVIQRQHRVPIGQKPVGQMAAHIPRCPR